MKSNTLAIGATLLAMGIAGMTGCSKAERVADGRNGKEGKDGTNAMAVKEERYPLKGEIVSVDVAKGILVVRHEDIKGYMPAMTMEFAVSAGDAAVAKPGQRIRAELVPSKTEAFRLEKIWPDDKVATDTVTTVARKLHEDTHNLGNSAYRDVGEKMLDFALYDQEGRVVQSARFRGKQIMINFIYTRCPDPRMCPAATVKMTTTQKFARDAGVSNLELVSITFEPEFDTPGVLNDYAKARAIDTSNFSFLTGPESAIKDLLTQFGVSAEFKGGLIAHTLTTVLIDENGKIRHRVDGSQWEPMEFVAKMKP